MYGKYRKLIKGRPHHARCGILCARHNTNTDFSPPGWKYHATRSVCLSIDPGHFCVHVGIIVESKVQGLGASETI